MLLGHQPVAPVPPKMSCATAGENWLTGRRRSVARLGDKLRPYRDRQALTEIGQRLLTETALNHVQKTPTVGRSVGN